MITTEYDPVEDRLKITIDATDMEAVSDTIDFKEFMQTISTEKARAEYLLSLIYDIRKKRLTKLDDFMGRIMELTVGLSKVRAKAEAIADDPNSYKVVKNLDAVGKMYLSEKNTLKEVRYAIKLLDNDEGKLMAELLKLSI